jgi:transcriptional regulator with XRE-family HTH domain
MLIGIRDRNPRTIAVSPIVTHSASRPDEAWRSSAPTARNPASTTANELVSPTIAATTPASAAWRSARRSAGPRSCSGLTSPLPASVPYTEHSGNSTEQAGGVAAAVGTRVRALRLERGRTLSQLARAAGIGKATLSGLEAGTRNATVETLYAVAAQLGVPLAALLGDPGAAPPRRAPLRGAAVAGSLLEALEDAGGTTELYRLAIRPGRTQVSPAHGPGVREYLTVFAGSALVGPRSAPMVLAAGEHGSWLADVPHVYATTTAEEVAASLVIRYPRASI